jgi:hypothetical protein
MRIALALFVLAASNTYADMDTPAAGKCVVLASQKDYEEYRPKAEALVKKARRTGDYDLLMLAVKKERKWLRDHNEEIFLLQWLREATKACDKF